MTLDLHRSHGQGLILETTRKRQGAVLCSGNRIHVMESFFSAAFWLITILPLLTRCHGKERTDSRLAT